MTLWTWVGETAKDLREAGHTEAADAVIGMPKLAVEGDVVRLRAGLPAALRAARDVTESRWLENFLEHWPLAARVGDRGEGATALPEAEARLSAAHVDGAECASAACAAENVLACYANIDGPGNAADRIALTTEAMATARIGEPAWESLVLAHANALIDDERPDEAVRVLDDRAREAGKAGVHVSVDYDFGYVRALRCQERPTEALQTLDRLEVNGTGTWPRGVPRAAAQRRIRFERARVLAELARKGERPAEDALAALPGLQEADAHPAFRRAWADAVEKLVAEGALPNDWRLGVTLTTWSRYFERVDARRPCLELSLSAARLAAARGAKWVAESALDRGHRALGGIRHGDDPAAELARAGAEAECVQGTDPGIPAEHVLAHLREEPPERVDPERQADLLITALEQRPDDAALLNALGQVGRTLMLTDAAAEPHWRHVRRDPGDQKAALSLLETLLYDNDTVGVRALVRALADAALVTSEPVS
ncbi:hypothetical protein [Allosalinactinospora lopnorensis]|uniref:hypothetical protein n=1 Tax=Allosalinactinospora lopnorensis TaxID=1352348 RepID=UPI000623DAE0|nr:hypothetical protein [Allosalinactinospora lopnorensis]